MTAFNIKLSTVDPFVAEGAKEVNLDDKREFRYTFWRRDKKKMYSTPNFFMSEALDLFYIALAVFYADRKVSRSASWDNWTREFRIYMPVLCVDKWNNLKSTVEQMLNFLTGDQWQFEFRGREYSYNEKR